MHPLCSELGTIITANMIRNSTTHKQITQEKLNAFLI